MNIIQYAVACEANWKINMAEITSYKPFTTFYYDFSIADCFGVKAIIDTYIKASKEWKNDVKYFTEFVIVLNHKSWQHHAENNDTLVQLYSELYYKARDLALKNFKDDELSYFLEITD